MLSLRDKDTNKLNEIFVGWNRNPMPSIKPLEYKTTGPNQRNYFEITNDGIFTKNNPKRDHIVFWDGILNEYKHHWNISFDFS